MPLACHASLTDCTRLALTPQGETTLAAADLRADVPRLYDAIEALARHAAASGASPGMARLIEQAVHALQA